MKFLNKLISFILCLVLIVNSSSVVYGAEVIDDSDGVHLYSVPVESNEYLKDSVTFYEFDGKYYLSLEDVKDFTRCTLTEDEEIITLTQGLREIVIDKSTGHMTDSDIVDQGNIILLEYDGEYLCEGIPMLIYLGATCTISEHNKLEVLMPVFTIWESIMPDYLDYYFNINELYGGEDNVKISLICDIIADVLDGVSGHGLMANADTHLEDALYEILNVDMMKYASVQETASAQNQKINDFLSSAVFGTLLDTSDNMYDTVYEALDYYSRFYVSAKNDILLDMMTQTDDLDYASELASQIKEQVYAQSATKANLKNAKKAQSFKDIGMLAFDTAITSYSMMQYNDDTKNLFARTINREMFEYANYYDISWNNVSDKISNTLKSTQSIVANTAIDNVAEFAVEKVTEEGAKTALSAFTSKANIYTAAIQIGSFIASLINYESNQAFSADMNAIWLSAVQYDVAILVSSLLVKERDEFQFSSAESLEKLKDMFTLYYRTTIAFSENIAKSIEEFGTKSNQKWVPWFSSTTEASVGNYAAAYLYRITNCEIIPIVKYSSIVDTLLLSNWTENYKCNDSTKFTYKIVTPTEEEIAELPERLNRILAHGENYNYLVDDIYEKLFWYDGSYMSCMLPAYGKEISTYIKKPDYSEEATIYTSDEMNGLIDFFERHYMGWYEQYMGIKDPLDCYDQWPKKLFDSNGYVDLSVIFDEITKNSYDGNYGYWKFDETVLDWLVEGVWNGNINHTKTYSTNNKDNIYCYYHDQYYYTPLTPAELGHMHSDTIEIITITPLDSYFYSIEYDNVFQERHTAIVAIKESNNGFRFWSIFSITTD